MKVASGEFRTEPPDPIGCTLPDGTYKCEITGLPATNFSAQARNPLRYETSQFDGSMLDQPLFTGEARRNRSWNGISGLVGG